ncbi:MAG: InlB B-repeat-containing protein, partial [Paludibacteraceae bacterium]|nr:InlB B-repeat-containing protein [Paludibacteraceae bacterium]
TYDYGTEITIEAIADKGYSFVKWSDGNTENPRTITITEDINLTAEFAIDQYQVTLQSNGNGSVTGSGTYDYGTNVTIEAIADKGYHFVKWSDGNKENPRTIIVTENITLSATFELDKTPVEDVLITSANVYTRNGILHVEGTETDYYVLDMAGRLIYSGRDAQIQLPRGVYVVSVNGKVQKVVL